MTRVSDTPYASGLTESTRHDTQILLLPAAPGIFSVAFVHISSKGLLLADKSIR